MATDKELLARLDERTKALDEKLDALDRKLDSLEENLQKNFVTQSDFSPIKKSVYSAIGLICTGFILAVITLVMGDPSLLKSMMGK
jgi:hypothetical protein